MVFPERLAAGPKARHGPQTERRAKTWNRCIARPSPERGKAVTSKQPASLLFEPVNFSLLAALYLLRGVVRLRI